MEYKILLIDRCETTPEEFCNIHFVGCEFIDGYILKYEGKEYSLKLCEEVGIKIKGVEIYRLIPAFKS